MWVLALLLWHWLGMERERRTRTLTTGATSEADMIVLIQKCAFILYRPPASCWSLDNSSGSLISGDFRSSAFPSHLWGFESAKGAFRVAMRLGRCGMAILKIWKIKIERNVHYERKIATINIQLLFHALRATCQRFKKSILLNDDEITLDKSLVLLFIESR